jgi:cytochrome c
MSSNNGMEINKIAAAIVLAGLIGMIAGKFTEFLYEGGPKHAGHVEEAKRGYKVEVEEDTAAAGGDAKPQGAPNIDALYATADVAKGAAFFAQKCAVCHDAAKGGANKVGPALWGVIGRQVAGHEGFNYSEGMKSHSDRTWTTEEMNQFQFSPRKWVPGTMMAYAGTPKDADRANLIAYLNSLSDSPQPLPVAAPAAAADEKAADEKLSGDAAAPKKE